MIVATWFRVSLLLVGILGLTVLAGCSAPPAQPSGSVITQTIADKAKQFEKGPHEGDLGKRQYHFDCSSTSLPDHYQSSLIKQAQYLDEHQDTQLRLVGYDASGGDPTTHLLHSYKRAFAVKKLLTEHGARESQITVIPRGSTSASPYTGSKEHDECRVDLLFNK